MKGNNKYFLSALFIITGIYLQAQTLTIQFDNIRNDNGEVSVTIYSHEKHWLDEDVERYYFPKDSLKDGKMTASIELEKPGTYAIAVLDDEDADGEMRYNFIGYPREGFGFSNNIHVWLSRPKFDECLLDIKSDTTIRISMQYK